MKQRESLFKTRVLRDLEATPDSYVLKTQERGRRGVPDILMCKKGQFIALELKISTGIVSKLQRHTLKRILASGGHAIVVTPESWPLQLSIIREM